jgi:hypothetical protein
LVGGQGSGFESSERLGAALAQQIVALVRHAQPDVLEGMQAVETRLLLPPPHVRVGHLVLPRWLGRRLVDDDATLSLLAVGPAVFIGVPCDLTVSLGAQLEAAAAAHGRHPVIVGFANDYIGYCVPAALYEQKTYESSMAFNGPAAGELIVSRLAEMIRHLGAAEGSQP